MFSISDNSIKIDLPMSFSTIFPPTSRLCESNIKKLLLFLKIATQDSLANKITPSILSLPSNSVSIKEPVLTIFSSKGFSPSTCLITLMSKQLFSTKTFSRRSSICNVRLTLILLKMASPLCKT